MSKRVVKKSVILGALFWIGVTPLLAREASPTPVRTLFTTQPIVKGLPCHLAAASGLALWHDKFLVVVDDALHLGVFQGPNPGHLLPLFDRPPLPLDPKERKASKPDLESCTVVRHGATEALLALGSGSKPNRRTGIFLPLEPAGDPLPFDLGPLYRSLEKQVIDLNVEGLAPLPDRGRLRLALRGNGRGAQNWLVDLDLEKAVQSAAAGAAWGPELLLETRPVHLGLLRNVALTFTDLAALPDGRCVFTAAAEDTQNPVRDGRILGSAVGVLSAQGAVEKLVPLEQAIKVEGIWGQLNASGIEVWMVTDADDPWRPAQLLKLSL